MSMPGGGWRTIGRFSPASSTFWTAATRTSPFSAPTHSPGPIALSDARSASTQRPSNSAPSASGAAPAGLTSAYLAQVGGRTYLNPTLVLHRDQRVRVDFVNSIDEPTIVHWHGLTVDTRNDGGGMTLAEPGGRYAYDFAV